MNKNRRVEFVLTATGQTGLMSDERPEKGNDVFRAKKPKARRFARAWRKKYPEWDFNLVP